MPTGAVQLRAARRARTGSSCPAPPARRGQHRGDRVAQHQADRLEPRQAPVEWRVRGKDSEEGVGQAGQRHAQQHRDGQQRAAHPRGHAILELGDAGPGDETAEHQRQQPRVRVVGPLQQHDKGDQQKRNRVERQDLLHQSHQRARVGPRGRLRRRRQILSRHQRQGGLDNDAVALDLQPDDLARAAVAAQIQERLVPIERPPVECTDSVPDLQACLRGRAVGRDRRQFQALANRPERGVDADDDVRTPDGSGTST